MADTWFTADYHIKHQNIMLYEDRPCKTIDHWFNMVIDNHNKLVKPEDTVYVLGDVTLAGSDKCRKVAALVNRLHGNKHLVLGNHDSWKPFTYVNMEMFQSVHTALAMVKATRRVIMMHDPAGFVTCKGQYDLGLCGHVHSLWKKIPDKNIINVGVDVWDYKPVNFWDIVKAIEQEDYEQDYS